MDLTKEYTGIIEQLLDEENHDPIEVYDENGSKFLFEQVAIIPVGNELYCVLHPLSEIEGVEEDEAIVFKVEADENNFTYLIIETDEEMAMEVFERYYDLLDEEE